MVVYGGIGFFVFGNACIQLVFVFELSHHQVEIPTPSDRFFFFFDFSSSSFPLLYLGLGSVID